MRRAIGVTAIVILLGACGGTAAKSTTTSSGGYAPTAPVGSCPVGDWRLTGEPLAALFLERSAPIGASSASAEGSLTVRFDNDDRFGLSFDGTRISYFANGSSHTTTVGGGVRGTYSTKGSTLTTTPTEAGLFAATDGKPVLGADLDALNSTYRQLLAGTWKFTCRPGTLTLTQNATTLTLTSP